MKKVMLGLSAAVYAAAVGATINVDKKSVITDVDFQSHEMVKTEKQGIKSFVRKPLNKKFHEEAGLTGTHNYIVRLQDAPVATYKGDIDGYPATRPDYAKSFNQRAQAMVGKSSAAKRASLKINFKSSSVKRYTKYLDMQQDALMQKATRVLGQQPAELTRLKNALNAVVVRMTQEQAKKLAMFDEVAYVEREVMFQMETDTGPTLIGAPNVWDGTATGVGAFGEGVIVGVIDSGINSDHPSFADVGDDGYDHTNPWGAGVYVGDCAGAFASMCNDKLIGVRSYDSVIGTYSDADVFGPTPPPANGEDYNGHGSHTAGTAAGNILNNVPMLDPEAGQEVGDGINSTGFEFPQVSGVAPHANVVAYQICLPGNQGDTYSGCPGAAIASAIDDAIADGIDVINYSISGGGNPWNSSTELAFLNAQDAGIFVSASAGNSGPDAGTSVKNAPWYTAVAASTHGRVVEFEKTIGGFTGGDTTAPAEITGSSATQGITATIVYAGDYDNPNSTDDSAQCMEPFPAGTFSGEIVVCDRGTIARVAKAQNAAAGGAGGFVLANIQGGADTLANDAYVVPGIHINANDGDALKAWLASGTGHTATISAADGELVIGDADQIAAFSSRGPNVTVPDILTPSVAAPGVSIYAAYSDEQYGRDGTTPAPADFAFLQGTSMAAPHVAGAGALLKSAFPAWTPDNIRSALMLTATPVMVKEDGTTPADMFDMGSGRIRVDLAAATGLIMDEELDDYLDANPADGGDPKTLNIPSLGNTSCRSTCSWQRTFTATKNASWTASSTTDNELVSVTVTPATFTLAEGETQTVTITASVEGLSTGDSALGEVVFTAGDASIPAARMPMFLSAESSNIPSMIEMDIARDSGSVLLKDMLALEITEFTSRVYGLSKSSRTRGAVSEDSDGLSPFDDLTDGVETHWFTLSADTPYMNVATTASESPDIDLYVGYDANGDGTPSEDELLCASRSFTADESCGIEEVPAGRIWVLVQNWEASSAGAVDGYDLLFGHVPTTNQGNFSVAAQATSGEFVPFDIRMSWDDQMSVGDVMIGAFDIGTDAANPGNLGQTVVVLTRANNDVNVQVSDDNPSVGDYVDFTVSINTNETTEDYFYNIALAIPEGIMVDPSSVEVDKGDASVVSVGVDGTTINWSAARPGIFGPNSDAGYDTTTNVTDASCSIPIFGGYVDLAAYGVTQLPIDGDSQTGTLAVPVTHLGVSYPEFTVTDDGFISMGNSVGGATYSHQRMPNSAEPNNVIAPFWRDMQFDNANGSGVSVASASGGSLVFVEWDDMRHWAYYGVDTAYDDVLDFQVVIDNNTGNVYYAYANVTHNLGDILGQSIGWENANGTFGESFIYNGGVYDDGAGDVGSANDIQDGLIVCNRPGLGFREITLTFTGQVMPEAAGASMTALASHSVTNVGAKTETSSASFKVASNFYIGQLDDLTVAEDGVITGITVNYADADSEANVITVTSLNGTASNISGGVSGSTFDFAPDADFNGMLEVVVTVSDTVNSTDTESATFMVNVTPVNDAPVVSTSSNSSGRGMINLLSNVNDVDGDSLTYSWTQVSGPSVTITAADKAQAVILPEDIGGGDYVFELTVNDGTVSVSSQTSISVSGDSSSSGSLYWMLGGLMLLAGFRRRK
ncbi:MAG: S8 family serine peptidase [Gammaproteobacteria bacterium]|nr:S8 family serine peptidase [Gammaproteobacteria bacterium]